jgi:ankyrin repeat protein
MSIDLIRAVIDNDISKIHELLEPIGQNPECDINFQEPQSGNTALHYAVKTDNFAMIELLLFYGAQRNIKNFKGILPMDEYIDYKMINHIGVLSYIPPITRLFLYRNRR